MDREPTGLNQAVRAPMDDNEKLEAASRNATIVRTSLIGIVANAFLAVFKAIIGIMSGSVAITMDANQIDALIRAITDKVYAQTGVYLTAISVYAYNTTDQEVKDLRHAVDKIVHRHENVLQMHGFYVDRVKKIMRFDLVVSFNEKDRDLLYRHVLDHVCQAFPDYAITANMDTDFSE
jgi:hypothetical protein